MPLTEADTRAKLIDPAIHKRGWTEDLIRREESAGSIEIIGGKARRRARGRVDYVLRVKVNPTSQPVALALIEAKKDSLPPGHGLDQGKGYAACKRLQVPFVVSSNGHLFVLFDRFTGLTSEPLPVADFPTPEELRARYEQGMGFSLEAPAARPLLTPYTGGEGTRRYYQDAAIRAVLEKIARCENTNEPRRALLSLATGAGKTFIAVNLLKRLADAGQLKRALFVCDRDELRSQFESRILLPERVQAMCEDLFAYLLATGGPEQKTIIFCARDRHADDVAVCLNNLYAQWCTSQGRERLEPFAFKCTAASSGNDQLPDLRGSSRSHFIATTVELLTTGVDVPCVRNIVFFKYLKSPISFYQMVGRGTRIDLPASKLMFRVYDYTDATRLFGEDFISRPPRQPKEGEGPDPDPPDPPQSEPTVEVDGFEVHVTEAGRYIVAAVDGKAMPVLVEEYRARLAAQLVERAHTLAEFRALWVDPPSRRELLDLLVSAGYSPNVLRMAEDKEAYDLYDVLAELGWGLNPRTREDRVLAFRFKHEDWLDSLPAKANATIRAITGQFALGGTEELENRQVLQIPAVKAAGGLAALKLAGTPVELLRETKVRMFAA